MKRPVLKSLALLALCGVALASIASTKASAKAQGAKAGSSSVALVNGTLIDGTGAKAIAKAAIVIENGRITAVGKRSAVTIPNGTRVIDVHGATILPGFIDTLVHHSFAAKKLQKWARAGVTTVRELESGTSYEQDLAFRDEALTHPDYARVVVSGPIVTIPGGYPTPVFNWPSLAVTSVDDARQQVGRLLDAGADTVVIALESGAVYGRSLPELTPEEAKAIVDVAHERGKTASARLSVSADLKLALDAGVDDVDSLMDKLPDSLIRRMVASRTSTMSEVDVDTNGGGAGFNRVAYNLRRLLRAGGKVALANDYGTLYTQIPVGMPMTEIRLMRRAGMTRMQIIIAATKNAAHVCNLDKDLGTLEQGKIADVLVVKGDPLKNLSALTKTAYVIHGGVVIRHP